jgi:hypothetical protein
MLEDSCSGKEESDFLFPEGYENLIHEDISTWVFGMKKPRFEMGWRERPHHPQRFKA